MEALRDARSREFCHYSGFRNDAGVVCAHLDPSQPRRRRPANGAPVHSPAIETLDGAVPPGYFTRPTWTNQDDREGAARDKGRSRGGSR